MAYALIQNDLNNIYIAMYLSTDKESMHKNISKFIQSCIPYLKNITRILSTVSWARGKQGKQSPRFRCLWYLNY